MTKDYLNALFGDGCLAIAMVRGEEAVLRVAGECMAPSINHQAWVRLERSIVFIPGDVVGFYCPDQHRLLVHRFLGYVRRRSAWKLVTMADRGTRPDPLVDVSHVLGRVFALDNRAYRVKLSQRLEAIHRYAFWCGRRVRLGVEKMIKTVIFDSTL